MGRAMAVRFSGVSEDNNIAVRYQNKIDQCLQHLDRRLKDNEWLAGNEFTAADVMTVWSLTGMREFFQADLSQYENILAYLQRVAKREAYKKAREKGDPDIEIESLIQGPPPLPFTALRK